MEVPPRVSPALRYFYALAFAGESRISGVGVGLQHPTKVHRNDIFQAGCTSSSLPLEDRIESKRMRCPQIALFGFSIHWLKIRHGHFGNVAKLNPASALTVLAEQSGKIFVTSESHPLRAREVGPEEVELWVPDWRKISEQLSSALRFFPCEPRGEGTTRQIGNIHSRKR
jgi:hypothetical protein